MIALTCLVGAIVFPEESILKGQYALKGEPCFLGADAGAVKVKRKY